MRYEHEERRQDGSRIKIVVDFFDCYGESQWRITDVATVAKGKRKWHYCSYEVRNSYGYLVCKEKDEYMKEKALEMVTKEEIMRAVKSAYASILPNYDTLAFRIH